MAKPQNETELRPLWLTVTLLQALQVKRNLYTTTQNARQWKSCKKVQFLTYTHNRKGLITLSSHTPHSLSSVNPNTTENRSNTYGFVTEVCLVLLLLRRQVKDGLLPRLVVLEYISDASTKLDIMLFMILSLILHRLPSIAIIFFSKFVSVPEWKIFYHDTNMNKKKWYWNNQGIYSSKT